MCVQGYICVCMCAGGEEEGDICTATYPDFKMLVLCN